MKLLDHVLTTSGSFSECRTYRYDLTRTWDDTLQHVLWIMLNPSTADIERDDRTLRRVQSYSEAWGYGGVVVCNLFALRSTDPTVLKRHPDPVGPDNDGFIREWVESTRVGLIVAAWGTHGALHNRALLIDRELVDHEVWCVGTTASGQPRHPCRLGDAERPRRWRGFS